MTPESQNDGRRRDKDELSKRDSKRVGSSAKEMKAKGILLVDARAVASAHPESFEVPEPEILRKLRKGDFVKVCCNDRERFWVKLVARKEKDIFVGRVANQLVLSNINLGDYIELHTCNIYDVERSG
jgi:hypothetical protein